MASSHPHRPRAASAVAAPAVAAPAVDGRARGRDDDRTSLDLRAAGGPTAGRSAAARYPVRFEPGVLDPANPALARAGGPPGRRLVVVEARVHELYGDRLGRYLAARDIACETLVLPVHEQVKTMDAVFRVADGMDAFGISRQGGPVIAIGGGVLTDVVGLACSLYRRSTPFVRVPTTLIGLVDAGAGARAGVAHGRHRHLLGGYRPAVDTLLDPAFLATLDRRQLGNGFAEILKVALVEDARLFDLLERHGRDLLDERFQGPVTPAAVLGRAVRGALRELRPDRRDRPERPADYGHAFSPTVERRALPELLHGEAVCVDMALTTVVARRRALLGPEQCERILRLMRRLELPVWHPLLEPFTLAEALADTGRRGDDRRPLPLPAGIGAAVFVEDLTVRELADAAGWLRTWSAAARVREECAVRS
ncbi:sedoheptulose 7-phosphate cyclase [Kitasatospora sp. NPDC058218]|uniref:sedoheptulose 7-phosphate cyclase n=1 Tax=Kitasatospora sp. NPDC058218 TaxID=3346385 RepID=UPI0036DCC408